MSNGVVPSTRASYSTIDSILLAAGIASPILVALGLIAARKRKKKQ
jgi:LPXTG-motif cell wall-anchored protein